MPIRGAKNVVQKVLELPPDLVAEVDAFAESRSLTFKSVVVKALQRHLAHPPPVVPDPPLPACDPDPVPARKPAPKRRKK